MPSARDLQRRITQFQNEMLPDVRLGGQKLTSRNGRGMFDDDGNALPVISVFDKFTRK